jgi:hypothetical protein
MPHDPLGFDPVAIVHQIKNPELQRALDMYRHNILVRGTTVTNSIDPGEPIAEDGQPMTLERRRELAAQRPPLDFRKVATGELDYRKDTPPIATEKLGTSSQARVDAQPEMTLVRDREMVIRKLTTAEEAEIEKAWEAALAAQKAREAAEQNALDNP